MNSRSQYTQPEKPSKLYTVLRGWMVLLLLAAALGLAVALGHATYDWTLALIGVGT